MGEPAHNTLATSDAAVGGGVVESLGPVVTCAKATDELIARNRISVKFRISFFILLLFMGALINFYNDEMPGFTGFGLIVTVVCTGNEVQPVVLFCSVIV